MNEQEIVEETTELIETPAQALSKTIDQLIAEMNSTTIATQEQYTFVENWLRKNRETQKVVETFFEADRVEAKKKYDEILENRRAFNKPLEAAEAVARSKMTVYATEQEKKRRAEAKIEEDRRRKEAEDAQLEKAEELSSMGRTEQAEKVLDRKVSVGKVETETQKVGKTLEVWTVKVTDKTKFLSEISAMPSVLDCIDISESKLANLFKTKGIKEFSGLVIEQTFRPVL